jgi:hypothetical protein
MASNIRQRGDTPIARADRRRYCPIWNCILKLQKLAFPPFPRVARKKRGMCLAADGALTALCAVGLLSTTEGEMQS